MHAFIKTLVLVYVAIVLTAAIHFLAGCSSPQDLAITADPQAKPVETQLRTETKPVDQAPLKTKYSMRITLVFNDDIKRDITFDAEKTVRETAYDQMMIQVAGADYTVDCRLEIEATNVCNHTVRIPVPLVGNDIRFMPFYKSTR